MQATSVFHPESPQARAIVHLFIVDLIIAAVILLTVAVLVAYAAFRFTARRRHEEPKQDPGDTRLEIVWTVIPAGILLYLLILTAQTMHTVNPSPESRKPDAVVIAHQWWWEYHYPESGVVTANELHMIDDRDWLLLVTSADVIHDFWVPDLGAKVDCIPGHPNHLWIKPHRNGSYFGTCAEYCGAEHAKMGIVVIVQSQADFSQWVQSQLRVPGPPTTESAIKGASLFQHRTCLACHSIAGTPAHGDVGPNLTHVADRQTLAAGVLANNPETLTAWIAGPQQIKPACHMPNLHLKPEETKDIVDYLEGLK